MTGGMESILMVIELFATKPTPLVAVQVMVCVVVTVTALHPELELMPDPGSLAFGVTNTEPV